VHVTPPEFGLVVVEERCATNLDDLGHLCQFYSRRPVNLLQCTSLVIIACPMIEVKKEGILLEATDNEFENQAVLNPTTIQVGNEVHLFYRAVKQVNYSSIGYAKLDGPLTVVERSATPVLVPSTEHDSHGVEDPRVIEFEGRYYMFYTAYDGKNALIGMATSDDLKTWKKEGIVSPRMTYHEAEEYFQEAGVKEAYFLFEAFLQHRSGPEVLIWDKDAYIFPERINGKIAFVHRILPDMQIAYVDEMSQLMGPEFWIDYLKHLDDHVLMENKYWYETRNIGGGGPPIKTDKGWLVIYHAVKSRNSGKTYSAAAALLDLENPQKVIARMKDPLFQPELPWELTGDVNNVVFPTGNTIFDGRLYMYYGAADSRIAVSSVDLDDLLNDLLTNWRHE